jgi:hypothetical protein
MGSCLRARRRKVLRSLLLKLFSRCFAFIVIAYFSHANGHSGRDHVAVAGFCTASFEGGCKAGGEPRRLLNCRSSAVRRTNNDGLS